jgi:hypothetical protein
MSNNVKQVVIRRSIGPYGVIAVILVVLKLIGEQFHTPVADWSWWLVLAPFWVVPAFIIGGMIVGIIGCFLLGFIGELLRQADNRRR